MIHLRVHEPGKYVRTFCNKVVLRKNTRPYREAQLPETGSAEPVLANSNYITCIDCFLTARAYKNCGWNTPVTVRRLRKFVHVLGFWPRETKSGNEDALELLANAQFEAQKMGDEINAKHKAAEQAVGRAEAKIARFKRKLALAETLLKRAEREHKAAIKKLAKTPTYVHTEEQEGDDHDTFSKTAEEVRGSAEADVS